MMRLKCPECGRWTYVYQAGRYDCLHRKCLHSGPYIERAVDNFLRQRSLLEVKADD